LPTGYFTPPETPPQTAMKATVNGASAAAATTTTQNVVFTNSATVTGIATNGLGAPLTGLSVRLKSTGSSLDLTTTTNGSGRFAFSGIPAGTYQVIAAPVPIPIRVGPRPTLALP